MGGRIELTSPIHFSKQSNYGTNFSFTLKLKINQEASSNETLKYKNEEKLRLEGNPKVLVAEDNLFNQKLFEIMLYNLGCDTDFASNGEEVLQLIKENTYSIILMDIQMPVMDGIEATKIIRSTNKGLPIVAVTANVNADDIESYKDAGMNDCVGKPFTEKEIYNVIKKWALNHSTTPISKDSYDFSYFTQVAGNDTNALSLLIQAALLIKDYILIKQQVYKIKSSFKIVGFALLFDLALTIENKCMEAENKNNLDKSINDLIEKIEKCSIELKKWVSQN
jgi:CheY-like chemotaxis protein